MAIRLELGEGAARDHELLLPEKNAADSSAAARRDFFTTEDIEETRFRVLVEIY
jgi:hypothetical protein